MADRRRQARLRLFYKAVNKSVGLPLNHLIKTGQPSRNADHLTYITMSSNIDCYKYLECPWEILFSTDNSTLGLSSDFLLELVPALHWPLSVRPSVSNFRHDTPTVTGFSFRFVITYVKAAKLYFYYGFVKTED